MTEVSNATIQRLIDKDQIRDAMARYSRGVDRQDWEAVRATFHEDGTDHHGEFRGTGDEFVEWVSARHAPIAKSQHFLGNSLIEFASDTVAVVETYFQAVLELGPEATGHRQMLVSEGRDDNANIRVEVIGRYLDRFEKRNGDWRVARRQVAFDATHSEPNNGSVDGNKEWVLGRRDQQDPVFLLRKECGIS